MFTPSRFQRLLRQTAATAVLALLPITVAAQHLASTTTSTESTFFTTATRTSAELYLPTTTSASRPLAVELPEAPTPHLTPASAPAFTRAASAPEPASHVAPKHWKYIPAGYTAQPLTQHDKLVIGVRDIYSSSNLLAIVFSAGWEQLTDTQPNYGTDSAAFGQRVGAAAIRDSAQGLLTDGVFAQLFHQDTRYWVQGPSHGLAHRAEYAISRVVVSKTDNGRPTFNTALWVGYAAVSALNNAYYPERNRNVHDNVLGYIGSLGGAALGYLIGEFSGQALGAVHLYKRP